MVSLDSMRSSNACIATTLPAGVVAVFVGAINGIGETTLKQFAKQTQQPRIYFLGRRESEGKRIQAELEHLNPAGTFLSKMLPVFSRTSTTFAGTFGPKKTDEGLHYPMALIYYSRTRFITNLFPQLQKATFLRRVVSLAMGGKEGAVVPTDWQANRMGVLAYRQHAKSMITLTLQAIARRAPEVAFVLKIPIEETGESQLYFATSARFPPGNHTTEELDGGAGVSLDDGVSTAFGADGTTGGGVYSIDYEGEGTSERVRGVMEGLRKDGMAEKVWEHLEQEFVRITDSAI